jgi:hypothetical protein
METALDLFASMNPKLEKSISTCRIKSGTLIKRNYFLEPNIAGRDLILTITGSADPLNIPIQADWSDSSA